MIVFLTLCYLLLLFVLTKTGKVPNTSATAASSGSDMNGMAALNAVQKIQKRLIRFAAKKYGEPTESIEFRGSNVHVGDTVVPFRDFVNDAYLNRVSLSATGFYRTPKIWYDREQARGRPFLYFAYGAAVSEVEVDTLTGENRIRRVDILHDAGRSLNPAIDMGQIEGGFVQGAGWLTTEEVWWDDAGAIRTHSPSTYKIPVSSDVPEEFHARIWQPGRNREPTIHRSKAVGEPPLMLAISVFHAIKDAVGSIGGHRLSPRLDSPATPEAVLMAVRAAVNREMEARRAEGELLFDATRAMRKRLDAAAARIRDSEEEVFGELRVTTTTGFGTADYLLWPPLTHAALLVLMAVGGCAGSTRTTFPPSSRPCRPRAPTSSCCAR